MRYVSRSASDFADALQIGGVALASSDVASRKRLNDTASELRSTMSHVSCRGASSTATVAAPPLPSFVSSWSNCAWRCHMWAPSANSIGSPFSIW